MAKYRKLTLSELNELEREFIEFLIINGISAEEWKDMKESDRDSAEKTLDLFSDVVFESVLSNIRFLESRSTTALNVFQCLKDRIVLVGLVADENSDLDFTNPEILSSAMLTPPAGLKVFTTSKIYLKKREEELFDMLNAGCVITDDRLFKALCLSLPHS